MYSFLSDLWDNFVFFLEDNQIILIWNDYVKPTWNDYIKPIIEILILAFIIYKLYKIISKTRAIQVIKGVIIIVLILGLSIVFRFHIIYWLLENGLELTALTFIILFQPELRNVLTKLGENRFWDRFFTKSKSEVVDFIWKTAEALSDRRIGALVAFEKNVGLKNFIETGVRIEGQLSYELLSSIFTPKAPLHDGAVIIQGKTITAAACLLELTKRTDLEKVFGTRHRAAIGLSEETDAVIVVVSEENGKISIAHDSKLYYGIDEERFRKLFQLLLFSPDTSRRKKEESISEIFKKKVGSNDQEDNNAQLRKEVSN